MATTGTRILLRTGIIGAGLVAVLTSATGDARANESGPDVNAINQAKICEAAGGKATIYVDRTVGSGMTGVDVSCHGGLLGGLVCESTAAKTTCGIYRNQSEEESHVGPTDGVEAAEEATEPVEATVEESVIDEPVAVDDPPRGESVDEAVIGEEPAVAEEPAVDEPVAVDPAVVEDGGIPATTVESVEPGVAEEPVVATGPVDMSISSSAAVDEDGGA